MAERRTGFKFIGEVSYGVLGAGEDVHVYPLFGREHDIDHGAACWCEPERDREEPRVIVHKVGH